MLVTNAWRPHGKPGLEKHSHNDGQENRRPESLEQNIGEWLKYRIRNEEYGKRGIVTLGREPESRYQPGELSISNVGTVKECEKIKHAELYVKVLAFGSQR